MKDTVVFVTCIICLCILGVVIGAVEISPDRLAVLRVIIDGLILVLGVSGRAVVSSVVKKMRGKQ